jgi:hypothetical protein
VIYANSIPLLRCDLEFGHFFVTCASRVRGDLSSGICCLCIYKYKRLIFSAVMLCNVYL